jgi:predicted Holliday junction resolvase-like endonuclease
LSLYICIIILSYRVLSIVYNTVKKNEIQNKKKYTREDLVTMDLAATHIMETAAELKHQTDKMEERLKSGSCDLYEWSLGIRKGMNIQN